jgi:hypothetical protein
MGHTCGEPRSQYIRSQAVRFATWALAIAFAFCCQNTAWCQAISGDLVGTVTDSSGAVLPSAQVVAVNTETGVKTTASTNTSGAYHIANLPVGSYNITATNSGFNPDTVNNFAIELNKSETLNLTLSVGSTATTVQVSEAAVALDTTTAQINSEYSEKEMADLPVASSPGGVLNLSMLTAGVSSSGGTGQGEGPSVGGQRPRNNDFTIEGVDNNNVSGGSALVTAPNDTVASFTLLVNQFSPEFGHSSAGQFNAIIVSGTNQLHGRAYEYFQNRDLNAIDYQVKLQTPAGASPSNARYDNNRFGGQIGGPIVKDKLFFFGNFEYNPVGNAAVAAGKVQAPTALGYQQLAQISGVNQTNLGILKTYVPVAPASNNTATCSGSTPHACINGVPVDVGSISLIGPSFSNTRSGVAAIDYYISDRDQLRGRYIYNGLNSTNSSSDLPYFHFLSPTKYHLVTLSEYHTFNSFMTNEVRIGYNHYASNSNPTQASFPGLTQFPNMNFADLNLQVGPSSYPSRSYQGLYQAVENYSWIKGKHTLKFGVEGRDYIAGSATETRINGNYNYLTLNRYLLDETPDVLGERTYNGVYTGNLMSVYTYANDIWKLRRDLMLNAGVRYEYNGPPSGDALEALNNAASVPGLISFGAPQAQRKNFDPRIGLAYSPGKSQNTSIRAGFTIAHNMRPEGPDSQGLPPQVATDCQVGEPITSTCQYSTTNFLTNGGIAPEPQGIHTYPTVASAIASTSFSITGNNLLVEPYTESWQLGVQHSFAKSYTFETRYVGTHGVHLQLEDYINRQPVVTSSNFLPTYIGSATVPSQSVLATQPTLAQVEAYQSNVVPAWAAAGFTALLEGWRPWASSKYDGLATQLNRRFDHGLELQAAWTWSHNRDDSVTDQISTVLTPRRPQNPQCVICEWGTSALDHRHRVTVEALYNVPSVWKENKIVSNTVGNWEISSIYTFESPEYATAQSNQQTNLTGDATGPRSIFNSAGVPGTGSDVTPVTNGQSCPKAGSAPAPATCTTNIVGYVAINPKAQYIRGGLGALNNANKNTMPMANINNWDATLIKRLPITEKIKLEMQLQAYNVFNHQQFVPGSLRSVNAVSQSGTSVLNMLTPGNSIFNESSQVFSSNPRTMQATVKVVF